MRRLIPILMPLILAGFGCDGEPGGPGPFGGGAGGGDDDLCPGVSGPPAVELIRDDERHLPVEDGHVYSIARRPQGDVTLFAPLAFYGLDGGVEVEDFSVVFEDEDGVERGSRRSVRFRIPCEDDGEVAGHWYEVFFGNPSIPASTWEGLHGTLTASFLVDGERVSDSVAASLHAE